MVQLLINFYIDFLIKGVRFNSIFISFFLKKIIIMTIFKYRNMNQNIYKYNKILLFIYDRLLILRVCDLTQFLFIFF